MGHPYGTFWFGISLRWPWRRCFPSTNRLDHHAAFGGIPTWMAHPAVQLHRIYLACTWFFTAFRIATLLPQSPSRYHPTITSFDARPEKDTTRLGTVIMWLLHYRDKLLNENMCCRVVISSFISWPRQRWNFVYLFIACSWILTGPYCSLSFRFSHFLSVTVSPMENKRDASVAGLGWPSTPNRGNPVTHPGASTIDAPAHTTSTPSASLEAVATPNDPGTSTPMDTYSAPPQPAVPFPTQGGSTYTALHHARFTSRVVHQIHFKIFTPTIPGSYSSKRFQPQESPNVVIPNTISTVFLATGSGLYEQRTIGAIILSSLYYMDIVPSTMFPSTRSLLLKHLTLPRRFEI